MFRHATDFKVDVCLVSLRKGKRNYYGLSNEQSQSGVLKSSPTMARSLPASPASDSSCSLPSTPKASREYFSKRQEASSSTPDGASENKLFGKPYNPLPVPRGTPRLNFATTRQALTPRRALTSVKPISKATRSSRKSFWLGTGTVTLISDDEEQNGSFSNDTAVSQSADLVLTTGAEEAQRVFDDGESVFL